jgi:hypothetical protein
MRLCCFFCGKSVSTDVHEDTILRALCVCPECIPFTIRADSARRVGRSLQARWPPLDDEPSRSPKPRGPQ